MHRLAPILLALIFGCNDGAQPEAPLSPEQAQLREVETECENARQLAEQQKEAALPPAASNNLVIPNRNQQVQLAGVLAYQECMTESGL